MIESPIVSTCVGGAATGAGAAEGVPLELDAVERPVVVDLTPAADVNATAVRRELTATVATAFAILRDQLRAAGADIGLPLFRHAVISRPTLW
jgi:hypothetical protein